MTVSADGREARTAARRVQLFGSAVGSLDGPELIRWLRKYTNAHPNPAGTHATGARRWLAELERSSDREPRR